MEKKDRFSLRKLKSGVVSVALGSLLVVAGTVTAEAAEGGDAGDGTSEIVGNTTPNATDGDQDIENTDDTQAVESDDLVVEVDTGETQEVVSETVVERHQGADREEVAINVAEEHFSDAEKAIIVNQDKYTDAISATNISQGEYPVLYTRAGQLGDKTFNYLGTMTELKEIYLLGGTTSINDSIMTQLTDRFGSTVDITRIDGKDRFETNAKAIQETFMVKGDEDDGEVKDKITSDHVVIASGETYTDALYGVSYANTINAPIILSKTDRLVEKSVQLIEDLGTTKVTIVGGPNTVNESLIKQLQELEISEENINRIAGATRYDGSVEVARNSYETPETVLIASGDIFTDALVSAPLAQRLDAPIILVRKGSMVEQVEKYLNDNSKTIETVYIQGGTSTINKGNEDDIKYAASEKDTQPVIIKAALTLKTLDENTVQARFVNAEEEFDKTHTIDLEEDEALVDGEERTITFEYAGKNYTVTVLYVTADTFVKEVDDIADVADIEEMDAEELTVVKAGIEKARTFYNALTAEAKEDARVDQRAGWITSKETAVEDREAVLYVIETINDLKLVDDIKQMDAETLAAEKIKIEKARSLYDALTDQAKEDDTVIVRGEALRLKEKALKEKEEELKTEEDLEDDKDDKDPEEGSKA